MGNVFLYGGQVTLIGLAIVFCALVILIACIYGLSFVMRILFGGEKKAKEEKPAPAPAPAPAPVAAPAPAVEAAPVVEEAAAEEGEIVTDPQIIAVIAAAIAACDANSKLVIRSVRRSSGWKKAARNETVCRF
ncbi:MAG: OadG family protein [Clostridia bacterium]|nr:OadG family protein [Clostridia bacterium]